MYGTICKRSFARIRHIELAVDAVTFMTRQSCEHKGHPKMNPLMHGIRPALSEGKYQRIQPCWKLCLITQETIACLPQSLGLFLLTLQSWDVGTELWSVGQINVPQETTFSTLEGT